MMAPHRVDSRKAYLSKAGHANLGDLLGQLTWLWNRALSNRKRAWKNEQRSISLYEQYRHLTATRTDPAWSRFPVKAQRSVLERLDRSYKAFFRKGGFPRFKSEHRGVRSFAIHNPPKVCRAGKWSWVKIKGVGRVKFRGGVPGGDIKLLRLVRTVRRVKIQFVCEREVTIVPDDRPMIGVDLGIKSRIALSNGETVAGVKLERGELKRRQRRLSKAKKGSRNRAKRRRELAREWQRVTEREKGALHELTAELVKRHSASWAVEDLQIPNMVRNRRLSRSIMEQQWGAFTRMLSYKAESAGGRLVQVPPHHTSRECSECGRRRDIALSVRVYRCNECGLVLDRDVNAARNVLRRATSPPPGGAIPGRALQADERLQVAASA